MNNELKRKIERFCRKNMGRESGHDYSHALRTLEWTKEICKREGIKRTVDYEIAAMLHDVALGLCTRAEHGEVGSRMVSKFLRSKTDLPEKRIEAIVYVVKWHNNKFRAPKLTKMLKVVTDADTLDLLGAVGIWRSLSSLEAGQLNLSLDLLTLKKHGTYDEENQGDRVSNTHSLLDQLTFQISSYETMLTESGKLLGQPLVNFIKTFRYMFWNELGSKYLKRYK